MKGGSRPTSLTAKLLTLAPGETFYLNDRTAPGKATHMERSITNLIAKSPALSGRTFKTERWLAVRNYPATAKPILAVTRQP